MSAAAETIANEPPLLRDDRDGVATLTLNRPDRFNALSEEMLTAMQDALDSIAGDESVRVVVIAGNGRAFCAGHDLKQMRSRPDRDYYRALFRQCSDMMLSITRLPQPVIARVHGIAAAAGCQLVATCDLAVAAKEARFGTTGIKYGLFCSTPSVALSRNVGAKHAFEMLFTGDLIDAETAREYGLVNRIVPAGDLDAAVAGFVGSITAKSRVTVASGKRLFYDQLGRELEDAYVLAAENMACDMMTEDAGEGIDAFMERRDPAWKHR